MQNSDAVHGPQNPENGPTTQRRTFRPSVDGMEQRLAMNGAFSTIGTAAHHVMDVKRMGGGHGAHHMHHMRHMHHTNRTHPTDHMHHVHPGKK